jgi:hypothetical protein
VADGEWHRVDVQTKRVDGNEIKPEAFYSLVDGVFVPESEEGNTQ